MPDDPIRDEIDEHLRMREEWLRGKGSADPAGEARRMMGNSGHVYEETRRVWIAQWMEDLLRDLRYAWRGFLHSPSFTLTAIVTIALGIGSASAVFSVVDRILFRPLPYADEKRLKWFGMQAPISGGEEFVLGSDYRAWKTDQTVFASMTSAQWGSDCNLFLENPLRATCIRLEANFFSTMGIAPQLGRGFTAEEDQANGPRTAIISSGLWQERFGGSPTVLQQTIAVDGSIREIVGVLPANFESPNMVHPDVVLPQEIDWTTQRGGDGTFLIQAFGRLKPGISFAQAEAEMQPLMAESLKAVPERFRKEVKFKVYPLRDRQVRGVKTGSFVLLGAVGCLLLISCLNVANLLLARSASRDREFAVRKAIGAGRGALIRQLLTESVLLGLFGGVLGVALGWLLLKVFVVIAPSGLPRLSEAALDGRVILTAFIASLATGFVFGVFPALRSSGNHMSRRTTSVVRQGLVAVQLAISLVLLTSAGLLAQSLYRLQQTRLGFNPQHLTTAQIFLDQKRYPSAESRLMFHERLEESLRSIPGIGGVAISDSLPPSPPGMLMIYSNISIEGKPAIAQGTGGMIAHRYVSPAYFSTLGIPILRGRAFAETDRKTNDTMVISELLAAKMFPGEDPIGRRVKSPGRSPWKTVIGVAADVKNGNLAVNNPEYYELGNRENGPRFFSVVLKASDTSTAARLLREEVSRLDKTIPVKVETITGHVSKLHARPRFQAVLMIFFAVTGVVLAAVGLYGVLSFLVTQRTREIGVRMAVGATRQNVVVLVLRQAGRWTIAGIVTGLGGAIVAGQWLRTLLFGVEARDPGTLVGVVFLLVAIAFLAAWLPARRAASIDPMQALRSE